ncbi:MAG: carbohydrate binding domain-containing protein, partial [Bacteroidetes bacterium]|nr:carbohydrate binding domain-containing protein [Bacteroidota bacterium]
MKKLTFAIFTIVTAFLFLNAVTLQAQEVVLTDEFDSGDGLWSSGWIDAASATVTFSVDNTGVLSGANSYKAVIVTGSADTYRIQRTANCALVAGYEYTLSFKAVADSNASINTLFEIAGDPYTKYINEITQVTATPQTFTYTMTATEDVPTNMVKLHYGGVQNNGRTIWVDSIVVTRIADPDLITQWGKTSSAKNWPVINSTAPGSAGLGGSAPPTGWSSIRGEFPSTLTATTDQAVVVTGQMEFVGGGGASAYTWLRYALIDQDSVTLNNAGTDTAEWVCSGTNVYSGYGFHPRTGTGTMSNGAGGAGTVWTISNGGGWNSTWSNGGKGPLSAVKQAPRNAIASAGTYNFAISVKSVDDTTNEVRWYLIKTDNSYWYGGTITDVATTKQFNGIIFGFNNDLEATQVNLKSVKAELGDAIDVPTAPWQAFYVDAWGKTAQGKAWPILNDSTYL